MSIPQKEVIAVSNPGIKKIHPAGKRPTEMVQHTSTHKGAQIMARDTAKVLGLNKKELKPERIRIINEIIREDFLWSRDDRSRVSPHRDSRSRSIRALREFGVSADRVEHIVDKIEQAHG